MPVVCQQLVALQWLSVITGVGHEFSYCPGMEASGNCMQPGPLHRFLGVCNAFHLEMYYKHQQHVKDAL